MITERKIKKLFKTASEKGVSIKLRDLAYVLVKDRIDDEALAYGVVYGDTKDDVSAYDSSEGVTYIRDFLDVSDRQEDAKKTKKDRKMSFDENRNAMIELIKQTQEAMDNGEMEKKDGLKIMSDIRVKLNDKFNVSEEVDSSVIMVEPKFNFVCPHTGKECYVASKEELMKKYDLVERNNEI